MNKQITTQSRQSRFAAGSKLLAVLLVCLASLTTYAQQPVAGFFSETDKQNIRTSAQTDWGKTILDTLKAQVVERLKHSLKLPEEEGGHLHDYFCPVHNVYLDFDWEKPHEHFCGFCGKSWQTDRIDWAWITELHNRNRSFLTSCMYLYLGTGDKQYARHIRNLLMEYADKYPGYHVHDKARNSTNPADYSAKLYAQSLDESGWFSEACRAYSVVKPTLTAKEIVRIETRLFREAANLLLKRGGGGNWQMWNNSGVAALGVVLNNDSIVDVALRAPKVGHRDMMRSHVNRDGWWNENSANYHFFPLRAILLTADAVRGRGDNLHDRQLEYMLQAPIKSLYADLTFPSHNDGWYGESLPSQAQLYEWGYARYRNPLFMEALQACYVHTPRLSPEALLTATDIRGTGQTPTLESYLFARTGYAMLRNGGNTVILKYGPSGGGHGHPDKLSISVHNGRSEILPDFGTCAYGIPDYLNWYKRTLSHNTVVVDFKDQKPSTGQLVNFEPNSVEAYADEAYPGVQMTRRLSLDGSRLQEEFECISQEVHTYDYVLLLTEKPIIAGTFVPAELHENVSYEQLKEVRKATFHKPFSLSTPSADITFQVDTQEPFTVFIGEASGVPPTNPSVKTVTGSERRPVQPCYPVIIRTRDENMRITSGWVLR